jgi:methylthioribulose-1-phosphate dehydratase
VEDHHHQARVPIFANDQDMARLAGVVDHRLDQCPDAQGYLIAGHGFYTWGRTVEDASRHIEAFEFLFACEVLLQGLRR